MNEALTGGCQCGAVRFQAEALGRASLCHCRMCQKAFGGIGGLLVSVQGLTWTRGSPSHYQSSNVASRGFCRDCGTPLTFETAQATDIAVAAFDRPSDITPVIQLARAARLSWFDTLHALPEPAPEEEQRIAEKYAAIISLQHPDHETDDWKPNS